MEKKAYSAPYAEKISFNYKDQVVATGADVNSCYYTGVHTMSYVQCSEQMGAGNMNN